MIAGILALIKKRSSLNRNGLLGKTPYISKINPPFSLMTCKKNNAEVTFLFKMLCEFLC